MAQRKALRGGGLIDETAFVEPSAYVNADSLIDQWSYIGKGAVIFDRSYVATRATIADGAVLRHANIGPFTTVGEGAIIGPDVTVGSNCIICPRAMVTSDVPDNTTVTSDCCGGGDTVAQQYSLIGTIPWGFYGSWNQFSVDMYGAQATDDWIAAGEPAVPIEHGFARPFFGAADANYTCDRIILTGYFSRNALNHVANGMTLSLVKQSGVIGTASIDTDILGAQNSIIDTGPGTVGGNILGVGDGLILTVNMAGGASPANNFEVGFLASMYHRNF